MKNTKLSSPKSSLWYAVIFLSPREGKFKQKNNQLFSWLKERRKDRGFSLSDDWPVGPVSALSNSPKRPRDFQNELNSKRKKFREGFIRLF